MQKFSFTIIKNCMLCTGRTKMSHIRVKIIKKKRFYYIDPTHKSNSIHNHIENSKLFK